MTKINIDTIGRVYGLTQDTLASILFPDAKYKRLALDRIRSEEAVLNITQVINLANHLGVKVDDLLVNDVWTSSRIEGLLTIVRDGYRVVLHNDSHLVQVYHEDVPIEQFIMNTNLINVNTFITFINSIITNLENDGPNS